MWSKMKIKEFLSKWKEGIRTLPALEQLKAKKILTQGTMLGFIVGFGIMALKGAWYFLLLGFCMAGLQFLQLIATNQQIENAKRVNEMIEEASNETNK